MVTKQKDWRAKCLAIIWLLVNTLLLFIFSGELYTILIRSPTIEKLELKSEMISKQNWKDSDIYIFDQEISDYMLWGYLKNEPIAKHFANRGTALDPWELYFDQNLFKSLFEKVIRENAVIPAQKLVLYYLLRRAQNEFPDLFSIVDEGLDYYVSKPERDPQCYFLAVYAERFNGTDLQILNKV